MTYRLFLANNRAEMISLLSLVLNENMEAATYAYGTFKYGWAGRSTNILGTATATATATATVTVTVTVTVTDTFAVFLIFVDDLLCFILHCTD